MTMEKIKILSLYIILFIVASCKVSKESNNKELVLDSLKKVYAGKFIGITLRNNQAHTKPLTSKYAYVDENKSDVAFELYATSAEEKRYRLSEQEGWVKVKTNANDITTDMVLIEDGYCRKSGYVHYSFVREFMEVALYDK